MTNQPRNGKGEVNIQTVQGITLQQGIDLNRLMQIPDQNRITLNTLTELIKTLEKELKTNEISQQIFNFLKNLGLPNRIQEVMDIDHIELGGAFYLTLTSESKKELINYLFDKKLKDNYKKDKGEDYTEEDIKIYLEEQKNWIKEKIGNIFDLDQEFRSGINKFNGIDDITYYYILANITKRYDEDFDYPEYLINIQGGIDDLGDRAMEKLSDFMNRFGTIDGNKELEKIFGSQIYEDQKHIIRDNGDIPASLKEQNPNLIPLIDTNREGFTSFNAHLTELTLSTGLQLFGETQYKKVYKKYFYKIIKELIEKSKGKEPVLQNIYTSKLKDLENKTGYGDIMRVETNAEKSHHILEWEISDDFDTKSNLYNIGLLVKKFLPDLNLTILPQKEYDIKAINTMNGEIKYKGLFVVNSGFSESNIVILENKSNGEKRLRLALECDNVAQDELIYLSSQIAYFLEHKKFLDNHQLFAEIYHKYNQIALKDTEIFDIEILEEQYERFFEDIIRPLTIEYQEEHGEPGKPKNTVLAGIYGTGKSQFLLNLLQKKIFKYKGKEYHINSNVINMSIMTFANMIMQDSSIFKKKLSDMYENTGLQILLVMEDLDVLINEEGKNYDIATECITTFFDGVGSIPISITTATNYPERISPRLLRPNRLENIIIYNMPLPIEYREKMMSVHIEKNKLSNIFSDDQIKKYIFQDFIQTDAKWFTSSHIGAFIKNIKKHIDFKKKTDPEHQISLKDIRKIYDDMPLGLEDIQRRQKELERWLEELLSKNGRKGVGFDLNPNQNNQILKSETSKYSDGYKLQDRGPG